MSRRRAAFCQDDVTRVARGLIAAGVPVTGARVDASGFTILTAHPPQIGERPIGEAKDAGQVALARLRQMAGEQHGAGEDSLLPH